MQYVFGVVSAAGGIISSSTHEFKVTVIQKRVIHYSNYYIEFVPPLDSSPAVFGNQLYPNISYNSVERGGKTTDNVVISEVTSNGFYMGTTDYWSNGTASTVPRNFTFVALCTASKSAPDPEPTIVAGCVASHGLHFNYTHSDVPPRLTKIDTGLYDIQFPELKTLPAVIVTQNRCVADLTAGNTRDNIRNNTSDNAILTGISKSAIRVKTGDSNGEASDRSFNFMIFAAAPVSDFDRHQFFYTGVLLAAQNDHQDPYKSLVAHSNGMGEIFYTKPFTTVPVAIAQQRYKHSPDGIGSGLDNAVIQTANANSVVVEAGDSMGWLAPRFVYVLAFAVVG